MAIVLEPIVAVGGARIAALACCTVNAAADHGRIFGSGSKVPVSILVAHAGVVTAYAPDGSRMPAKVVEQLCPGAMAAVRHAEA